MRYIKTYILALIIALLATSNSFAEHAFEFPNGVSIKIIDSGVSKFRDEYTLKEEDNFRIQWLNIFYADWYKDYVYGYGPYCPELRYNRTEKSPCNFRYFVYKKWERGIRVFEELSDFEHFLEKNDFPKWNQREALFDGYTHRKKRENVSCSTDSIPSTPSYIKLTNGLYLINDLSEPCQDDNYKLTDENFQSVMQPYIKEASWYGDYVYGSASNYTEGGKNPYFGWINFIYKKGDKEAKYFEGHINFKKRLKSLGIPEGDSSKTMFHSVDHGHRKD